MVSHKVTITINAPDDAFASMTPEDFAKSVHSALCRGYQLLSFGEIEVTPVSPAPTLSIDNIDDELSHEFGSVCFDDETERHSVAEYIYDLITQ